MTTQKAKWKGSLQRARRLSQGSPTDSRKTSLIEEETSSKELEEYLETLKKKSGIKSLWTGQSFDKLVREEEDITPDISISSVEDDDLDEKPLDDNVDYDDDFRPNLQMFSRSPSPSSDNPSESSINPMKGLQMAEFAFRDDAVSDNPGTNNELEEQIKTLSGNDVRSVINNLTKTDEVQTEDEVEEEIEEDIIDQSTAAANKKDTRRRSTHRHSVSEKSSPLPPTLSETDNRTRSKHEKSKDRSKHSYTSDFSSASEARTLSGRSHSQSYSETRSERSSASSRSSRSSRTSRSSRHSRSSRSHDTSRTDYSKSETTDGYHNRYKCDVGVQTATTTNEQFSVPPGLGVGMATSGVRLGMQYVDPSPIATHSVSAEALEAVTAYNPAIVVLNNMLREQIRLVEQFVQINQRMYESYHTGVNNSYRYTTLEDTQEFIRRNRPKTITFEEALKQVKQEER